MTIRTLFNLFVAKLRYQKVFNIPPFMSALFVNQITAIFSNFMRMIISSIKNTQFYANVDRELDFRRLIGNKINKFGPNYCASENEMSGNHYFFHWLVEFSKKNQRYSNFWGPPFRAFSFKGGVDSCNCCLVYFLRHFFRNGKQISSQIGAFF